MSLPWLLYFGVHEFGLTPMQTLRMKRGMLIDLISCLAVSKGTAKEKKKLSFDDVLKLE